MQRRQHILRREAQRHARERRISAESHGHAMLRRKGGHSPAKLRCRDRQVEHGAQLPRCVHAPLDEVLCHGVPPRIRGAAHLRQGQKRRGLLRREAPAARRLLPGEQAPLEIAAQRALRQHGDGRKLRQCDTFAHTIPL